MLAGIIMYDVTILVHELAFQIVCLKQISRRFVHSKVIDPYFKTAFQNSLCNL